MKINTLLEVTDAARVLDLSSEMVRILADDGRLPIVATTPRGSRLFHPDDVEQYRRARARAGK